MSHWTHIKGIVTVIVPGDTQHECDYILNTVLDHLPLVTGSEGDMTIKHVCAEDYTISSSANEFQEQNNNLVDKYGYHSNYGWMKYCDEYQLIIKGDLRDRVFDQTFRELQNWLCRLAKRLHVLDLLIMVEDSYALCSMDGGRRVILTDADPYYDMFECPSCFKLNNAAGKVIKHETAWWEYLKYERYKNTRYPKKLVEKYYPEEAD